MNILYLCQRVPYPPNKGEKIRTYHQIAYLKEQGCQLTVLCPTETKEDLINAAALADHLQIEVTTTPLSWRVLRLAMGLLRGQSLSTAHFWNDNLSKLLSDKIQTSAFDWIICTSSAMAYYLTQHKTLIDKQNPRPALGVDFMDLDSDKWAQYAESANTPMRWVYHREEKKIKDLEHWSQHHCDACWFISDNEVALLSTTYKDMPKPDLTNVSAIGNGIDLSTYRSVENRSWQFDSPTFLFTGVMDYLPNEDAAIQFLEHAWPKLLKHYPKARFVVAGMHPTSKLEHIAKQTLNVTLTGFVDDIIPYYQTADIFVAPFTLARGVQNKILQAMACGLPVMTTPLGAEGIAHHVNTDLLITQTPQHFADDLLKRLSEPEKLIELGSAARQQMEAHYAWQAQLRPFLEALQLHKAHTT